MGKVEEEQSHSSAVDSRSNSEQNAGGVCRFCGLVRFRCVFALLMGIAVLLSAVFWLPPFLQYGDHRDLDLDSQLGDHDIVASFMVEKPGAVIEDNILRLEDDIFDEIGVPTTKVEIIYLESSPGSNKTKVYFAMIPDEKNSRVSSTAKSLVRSSFEYLVTRQSSLRLTVPLFGDTFSLEVLKFPGGITISPPQRAFLLQEVQIVFNFTLNFSISQIQDNFNELTSQLKSGLHLAPYENLYMRLTNTKGSTVAPPTTIQSSVLLAIGTPSMSRFKQLARTITSSHGKNLGLNNTVFGRVKQVRLSSIPQHSLGGDRSPSPAPLPSPHHHHHHRHHHHHHHHQQDVGHLAPDSAPPPATEKGSPAFPPASSPAQAPAPAPEKFHETEPPACHYGYKRRPPPKDKRRSRSVPPVAPPIAAPDNRPSGGPSQHPRVNLPTPVSHSHPVPASSPLPNVVFAHTHPPAKKEYDAKPPDIPPSSSPTPHPSSSAGGGGGGNLACNLWTIPLLLPLVLHL